MSVETDYKSLANRLLTIYSKQVFQKSMKGAKAKVARPYSESDRRFLLNIIGLANITDSYKEAGDLDKVLDTIDLAKIYSGVDKREQESDKKKSKDGIELGYEDFLVLELLHYFKHDFFKWITIPECSSCKNGSENVDSIGIEGPPINNPDEITRIEKYRCKTCQKSIDFPRINSPTKLLQTREGRCGEWVNCFMLILRAVLGADAGIRYVWNFEDHVWCEYYSSTLSRWVHIDPCEAVFDEPNLYCENWGKKMSWVIGINDSYMIDLSEKYITSVEKRIPKTNTVSNVQYIKDVLHKINCDKLLKYYFEYIDPTSSNESEKLMSLYNKVILIHNREKLELNGSKSRTDMPSSTITTKGRQTGGTEWTKARGEDG